MPISSSAGGQEPRHMSPKSTPPPQARTRTPRPHGGSSPHRHDPRAEPAEHDRERMSPFKTASARLLREHMDQIEAAVLDAGYASVAAFVNECFLNGYSSLGYEREADEIRRHYGSPRRTDRMHARELVKKISASVYSQEDPEALRRLERVLTQALDGAAERPSRKRSGEHLTPQAFKAAQKLPSTAPPKKR